jgi:hypothetical protein
MICPKCEAEYKEGFTKCDDCDVALIEKVEQDKTTSKVSGKGLSIIAFGIKLLFATNIQIIVVLIAYEFYFVYCKSNGGAYGTVIENIHPIIWCIALIEAIISVTIIFWGASFKSRD